MEELITLEEMDELAKRSEAEDDGFESGDTAHTRDSLRMLAQCSQILAKMYRMTNCPTFQVKICVRLLVRYFLHTEFYLLKVSHRLRSLPIACVVDPVIPDVELRSFDVATDTLVDIPFSYKSLQTTDQYSEASFLEKDRARGLLRVWYLLFDGLTSALPNCPREHQSLAVDTLFEMLDGLCQLARDGSEDEEERDMLLFGLYCANHLLLPTLQTWLRRSQRSFQGWRAAAASFKHCAGRATELVIGWVGRGGGGAEDERMRKGTALALKQLLLILTECTTVPVEAVARLGCSCFRWRTIMILHYSC